MKLQYISVGIEPNESVQSASSPHSSKRHHASNTSCYKQTDPKTTTTCLVNSTCNKKTQMDKVRLPYSRSHAKSLQRQFRYGRDGELHFNQVYHTCNTQHFKFDGLKLRLAFRLESLPGFV